MICEKDLTVSGALGEYLEAIYALSEEKKCVRITDISMHLGTSKPSVNRAVNVLCDKGYVFHKPYGDIILTDMGKEAGLSLSRRRSVITKFLTGILHIPYERALKEAGYIERGISSDTIEQMGLLTNSDI